MNIPSTDFHPKRSYDARTLRGGRLVKCKGAVVSVAPMVSVAVLFMGLSSGVASAQNQCGINTPGPTVLTCPAGTGEIIYATSVATSNNAGDGMTLILDDENIVLSGPNGVQVRTSLVNTGDITVRALRFGSITTTGFAARGFWIDNRGVSGDVDVVIGPNAGRVETSGFQAFGVFAAANTPGVVGTVGNASAVWLGGGLYI